MLFELYTLYFNSLWSLLSLFVACFVTSANLTLREVEFKGSNSSNTKWIVPAQPNKKKVSIFVSKMSRTRCSNIWSQSLYLSFSFFRDEQAQFLKLLNIFFSYMDEGFMNNTVPSFLKLISNIQTSRKSSKRSRNTSNIERSVKKLHQCKYRTLWVFMNGNYTVQGEKKKHIVSPLKSEISLVSIKF